MSHERTAHPPMGIAHILTFIGPLVWAVLVLFHPLPGGDSPYEGIKDVYSRWLVVHVGQLILTPFLFLAVWKLLDGLSSVAATVSRCALVVWTVFFSAYDSIQGVTTGVLARHANDLAGNEQAGIAAAIDYLVEDSLLAGDVSFIGLVTGAAGLTVSIAGLDGVRDAHRSGRDRIGRSVRRGNPP